MGWSGGNFTRANGSNEWQNDASLNIGIEPGRHDAQDNDLATGINQCINKDGSNSMTGPFNAGGQNVINAAKVAIGTTTPTELLTVINNTVAGSSFRSNGNSAANELFVGQGGSGYAFVAQRSTDTILDLVCGDGSYLANGAAIRLQSSGATRNGTILFSTTQGGTGVAERMRIANTGAVTIGTATSATGNQGLTTRGGSSTSADFAFAATNTSNTILCSIRNDGLFSTGVAANSPYNITTGIGANMYVNSNGELFRSTSSLKYKTDVVDYDKGLAEVLQIQPKYYKATNNGDHVFAGLIAEQLHAIGLSEFVQYAPDESPDAISYGNMTALLIKAIQELNAKVTALETQLSATTETL
jgi:hypothetical protein